MKRNFVIDEEISLSNGNDILKTEVYADTLSEVISNAPKDRVFTIGLFGSWGSGKSSIIKTVREKIETSKVKFITYDAWKYVNDSFRRMFLLKIQEELKYEQTEEMQRFYQSETAETEPKTYISKQGLWILILCLLVILVIVNSVSIIPDDWKVTLTSTLTLLGLLITVFNGVFQKLKIQINKPHLFAPEQFENCFKDMTTAVFKKNSYVVKSLKYIKLIPNSITGIERLIIVIDNIDRCHSEMAYQLLTDVKTFLSNEKKNVVFIIPVDDEALKRNLFGNHDDDRDCNKEKEEFLRKFFNVTIRIKPHQPTELNTFAKELNNKYSLGFNNNTVALCSKEFATNPRRIIQLYNNLASELSLYSEEFAQKNESMICIVLILREEYADFYQEIVNDANKLKNYKYKTDKARKDFLSDFMKIASPIIREADMSDLLLILTNSDAVFDGIPNEVKKRINSYATEETTEYIKTHPECKDVVLDFIKKNAKEDVKSHSDAQIVNSIEYISSLTSIIDVPTVFLVEINSLFDNLYGSLFNKIDKSNLEKLCQFALLLEGNSLPELKQVLISYITNINAEENLSDFEESLIKAGLKNFNTTKDSTQLSSFVVTLFKKIGIYKDIDYSLEQKDVLFSKDLINHQIDKIAVGENDETQELLWLLKNKTNIEAECYTYLCDKLNNLIGSTTNKNKNQMFTIVKYVADFILLIPDRSNVDQFEVLNMKLWRRTVNNRQICLLDEHNGEPENSHFIIDLFLKFYRINNGVITNEQVTKIVTSDKQYVYSKLLELKEQGFDLRPFWDVILCENDYETNIEQVIPLIEFCILQKDKNGALAIAEDKIKNKVLSLCDNISNTKVLELIERLIKDEKVKPYFIETITTRDAIFINALPLSLIELAINSFNQENSSQFVSNFGLLSVVASKGSIEQKTVIVKMMTENINKKKNLIETFDILDNIELRKKSNKTMLSGALQSYKESNPDDGRVDQLIVKFEK